MSRAAASLTIFLSVVSEMPSSAFLTDVLYAVRPPARTRPAHGTLPKVPAKLPVVMLSAVAIRHLRAASCSPIRQALR